MGLTHTFASVRLCLASWLLAMPYVYASSAMAAGSEIRPAAFERPIMLQQAKQPLVKSLIQLGQQSNISIIAPARLIRGLSAPALRGSYSPREALNIMLSGSNLYFEKISEQVIAIKPFDDTEGIRPTNTYVLEEVSVIGRPITGSHLRRMDVEGSAPVDIISGSDIAISGSQTLGEFLKYVPSVSGNSTSTAVSNGGDGTASVTLRGMPANNTLVLLNGKRIASKGLRGDAVDLNTIPPSAIERVEILKDGASAIYGSDAIAGVVNIIMKSDFDGLYVDQYYGESGRGDIGTYTSNLMWGVSNFTSSILVSASLTEQKGLFSRERTVSSSANATSLGGVDMRSSATPDPRITLPNGDVVVPDGQGGYRDANDDELYDYAKSTSTISPSQHNSLYLAANHTTQNNTLLKLTAGYTKSKALITYASTPIFTAFERQPITAEAGQLYNPFGVPIADIRRRITELPARQQRDDTNNWHFGLSAESHWGRVNWRTSGNWSKTRSRQHTSNIADGAKIRQALSASCLGAAIDGCVPLNIFGPEGSIDSAQLDYISTFSLMKGETELHQYAFDFDTSWHSPIGPQLLAAGLEWRYEKVSTAPVYHNPSDELIGGDDISSTVGSREIAEFYVETQIPLLQRNLLAYSLDLELSARVSNYSDFGSSVNPKVGIRYRPVESVLLRGTYTEGFRAPSISELHRSGSFNLVFLDDPCSKLENVGVLPGCSQQSDPTRFQFLTEFSGDEDLKPEQVVSHTIGLVLTPTIKNIPVSVSIDYFSIEQENGVNANALFLVEQNAYYNRFNDQVIRDINGNISQINAPLMNLGNRDVSGVDVTLSVQWKNATRGLFKFTANASHLTKYTNQANPNMAALDAVGTFVDEASEGNGALPDWKMNAGIHWSRRRLEANYTMHYVSSLKEKIPDTHLARSISSMLTHDLQLSVQPQSYKSMRVSLGIDNLFDTKTPFSAAAFNDNYDSRTHDIKGRFWYLRLAYDFY